MEYSLGKGRSMKVLTQFVQILKINWSSNFMKSVCYARISETLMKYLVLALLFPAVVYSSNEVTPNSRVTTSLKVRTAPNSSAAIIGTLAPGDTRTFLSSLPYYYEIMYRDDQKGYIHKGYSKLINNTPDLAGVVSNEPKLVFHFIDVGQGDATLISCPNGENILVDAGSTSGASAENLREYIEDTLRNREYRIHSLIITHPDADHYNLLEEALGGIPITNAYWAGVYQDFRGREFKEWFFGNHPPYSKLIRLSEEFFNDERNANTDITCGDADIYILAAGIKAKRSRKNALSIVIMVDFGDLEAILTGDATTDTEAAIMSRYTSDWLNVDLLKVGHHGSLVTSTSQQWVDTLKPNYSVISAGYNNSHGHPRKEVVDRLLPHISDTTSSHILTVASGKRGSYNWEAPDEYSDKNVYSTVNSGTVVVEFNRDGSIIIQE